MGKVLKRNCVYCDLYFIYFHPRTTLCKRFIDILQKNVSMSVHCYWHSIEINA